MNTKMHCPECGLPDAHLAIEGERSCLFECSCGHSFELDRPMVEPVVEFETAARCLWRPRTNRQVQQALFEKTEHPT